MENTEDEAGMPVRHDSPVNIGAESFSVNDISSIYGISRDEIERAVYNGELKADRAGEAIVRIHASDLLAWLNQRGPGI